MNKLRPVLVREGILDSDKVCRLAPVVQLFFRNLLHACDGADRFDANADDLRLDLYRRALDRVKKQHVEQWLQECREARLIELYTRSGRRFGRVLNYGQRDAKRKAIHPPPEGEPELPLGTDDPPPPLPKRMARPKSEPSEFKRIELNRIEEREAARNAPPTLSLSDDEWLRSLVLLHPHVNIAAEFLACQKKYPKTGRNFFETKWLANCERGVTLACAPGAIAVSIEPEPEAWKLYLRDHYEGESWAESAAIYTWAEMPAQWRAKLFREMQK